MDGRTFALRRTRASVCVRESVFVRVRERECVCVGEIVCV